MNNAIIEINSGIGDILFNIFYADGDQYMFRFTKNGFYIEKAKIKIPADTVFQVDIDKSELESLLDKGKSEVKAFLGKYVDEKQIGISMFTQAVEVLKPKLWDLDGIIQKYKIGNEQVVLDFQDYINEMSIKDYTK